MASKTTNYGLHKFDLTDSPPDITVINDSMDKIDEELKKRFENTEVIPVENGGTGAESLYNFVKSKNTLNSDIDVGTICEPGIYYVSGSQNLPTNNYGILIVYRNSNYAVQIFYNLTATGKYTTWKRTTASASTTITNDNWTVWKQIYTSNDTVPVLNGGTGATDAQGAFNNLGQRAFMGASTDVNSPNQAGCYNSNGWRQTGGAKDLPTNSYGIFENKQAGGYIKQTYASITSAGDYGLYVRLGAQSNIADMEWQRVYTSRNAAALIQNLLKGGSISVVKSIQHKTGTITGTNTSMDVTISAVDLNKSFISFRGGSASAAVSCLPIAAFKNSTTITVSRQSAATNAASNYAFDVVEYY